MNTAPLSAGRIFAIVTIGALGGMALGAVFGVCAKPLTW